MNNNTWVNPIEIWTCLWLIWHSCCKIYCWCKYNKYHQCSKYNKYKRNIFKRKYQIPVDSRQLSLCMRIMLFVPPLFAQTGDVLLTSVFELLEKNEVSMLFWLSEWRWGKIWDVPGFPVIPEISQNTLGNLSKLR